MYIMRINDGHGIAFDEQHRSAVLDLNWRAYSHDAFKTCEVANDCWRDGPSGAKRTTQMLSRFLMARILGRELDDSEMVHRKRQKIGTLWDFRDKNLELVRAERGET